jgi:UDP-N-acetylglucosamine/UDP-N-acetylgalactosamine diphosphorylase
VKFSIQIRRGQVPLRARLRIASRSVFLRERRIFLGGLAGVVGPARVGYGSIVAAGQIVRKDVDDGAFVLRGVRAIERNLQPGWSDRLQPRLRQNIAYVAQLFALRQWYREVRLARLAADDPRRIPVAAGADIIEQAIAERRKQLLRFVEERGGTAPSFAGAELPRCPWSLGPDADPHLEWVRSLSDEQVATGQAWLASIAAMVEAEAEAEVRAS